MTLPDSRSICTARTRRTSCGAKPGRVIAWRGDAVCRATGDGAVWITHLRAEQAPPGEQSFKLPATHVLREYLLQRNIREAALPIDAALSARTYRDIWYEDRNGVGYLFFEFHNGAMSTAHCQRLLAAYVHARRQPTRVIVLMGGRRCLVERHSLKCDRGSRGLRGRIVAQYQRDERSRARDHIDRFAARRFGPSRQCRGRWRHIGPGSRSRCRPFWGDPQPSLSIDGRTLWFRILDLSPAQARRGGCGDPVDFRLQAARSERGVEDRTDRCGPRSKCGRVAHSGSSRGRGHGRATPITACYWRKREGSARWMSEQSRFRPIDRKSWPACTITSTEPIAVITSPVAASCGSCHQVLEIVRDPRG